MKVQHAYGTNGIITAMDCALVPATDWVHTIALFGCYDTALRFAAKAQAEGADAYLMTVVEGRIAPVYKRLAEYFPADKDAVFSMIAPQAMEDFRARVADMGGEVSLAGSLHELEAQRLPAAWECGCNHTTLQAVKHEPGVCTYLHTAYPSPFDPDAVQRQMARYGDEVLMHHEMARLGGEVQIFALPLVRWTGRERMYEITADNPDQSVEKLNAEVAQIKALGIIGTGYQAKVGIGAIDLARVHAFYELAVDADILAGGSVDISKVSTDQFVNKKVGTDLLPK